MRYYATLGPACCEASALSALLRRGVSGFRLNVSHTMLAARRDWIDALHDAERSTGLAAQLMIDLRGPEVRIGALPSPLTLTAGEAVTLGADIPVEKDVLAALVPGMTILLDDGAMALTVLDGGRCRVTRGGVLTGHKSLTPEGTELHRPEAVRAGAFSRIPCLRCEIAHLSGSAFLYLARDKIPPAGTAPAGGMTRSGQRCWRCSAAPGSGTIRSGRQAIRFSDITNVTICKQRLSCSRTRLSAHAGAHICVM